MDDYAGGGAASSEISARSNNSAAAGGGSISSRSTTSSSSLARRMGESDLQSSLEDLICRLVRSTLSLGCFGPAPSVALLRHVMPLGVLRMWGAATLIVTSHRSASPLNPSTAPIYSGVDKLISLPGAVSEPGLDALAALHPQRHVHSMLCEVLLSPAECGGGIVTDTADALPLLRAFERQQYMALFNPASSSNSSSSSIAHATRLIFPLKRSRWMTTAEEGSAGVEGLSSTGAAAAAESMLRCGVEVLTAAHLAVAHRQPRFLAAFFGAFPHFPLDLAALLRFCARAGNAHSMVSAVLHSAASVPAA